MQNLGTKGVILHSSAQHGMKSRNLMLLYCKTYTKSKDCENAKPWNERCYLALPCTTQNEIGQSRSLLIWLAQVVVYC
ncbi:hypothetical protein MKX03_023243 [Papaver bracteatum]|nr:hypothetical protein MKX03_023243 [Papaver bracteatum]